MAMNSSGPISLAGTTAGVSIEIENGGNGTTQISLNDAAVRSLAGVPSGTITMPTDFYGKSNLFSFAIASNTTNVNLRSAAITAGWNQSSALQATINSSIVVYSTSTGSYAMTVNGAFPGGVTLVNNGTILGKGGDGGSVYSAGSAGGPALLVSSAVTINNGSGRIAGGGGGGGGGTNGGYCLIPLDPGPGCDVFAQTGGGGGGGGIGISSGGTAGSGTNGERSGNPGGAGTLTSNGTGGSNPGGSGSSAGGSGGSYGAAGTGAPGGSGGAAGAAVVGNSNITWTAFGTRNGSIS
jgi:hypothetical protein